MTRRILLAAGALALLGAGGPALAGFDLVLKDGVTIQADTLRRYGSKYEVRSWSGETMMIDASEIAQIRASEDPSSGSADSAAPANRVRSSPEAAGSASPRREPSSGPAPAPRAAPPPEVDPHMPPRGGIGGETLSGPPVRPPTVEESLGTLDSPSEWSKPSIDPTWQPTDAFGR
jgi:hypothetical protein